MNASGLNMLDSKMATTCTDPNHRHQPTDRLVSALLMVLSCTCANQNVHKGTTFIQTNKQTRTKAMQVVTLRNLASRSGESGTSENAMFRFAHPQAAHNTNEPGFHAWDTRASRRFQRSGMQVARS